MCFTPESGHVQCTSRFVPIADIQRLLGPLNSDEHSSAGQNNPDFGELAELCIDLD